MNPITLKRDGQEYVFFPLPTMTQKDVDAIVKAFESAGKTSLAAPVQRKQK